VAAGGQGHAAGELGDGRALLVWHHDGGRQVVAEEQLVFIVAQVVLAVSPGGLGVGAVAGSARRGPGEGLQVAPVHGQRAAGVPGSLRDAGFEQVVAGRLQHRRRAHAPAAKSAAPPKPPSSTSSATSATSSTKASSPSSPTRTAPPRSRGWSGLGRAGSAPRSRGVSSSSRASGRPRSPRPGDERLDHPPGDRR
jgi:hypothetical protein